MESRHRTMAELTVPLLAGLSLVLAACGGGAAAPTATTAPRGVATATAAAPSATTTRSQPTATITGAGKPKPEGKITIASPDVGAGHLIVWKAQSGSGEPLDRMMYDSLLFTDKVNNVIGRIATKWEANAEGTVWTFTVRNDVKFHNGQKMTVEDVAYGTDLYVERSGKYGGNYLSSEVLDNSRFAMKFSKPNPLVTRQVGQSPVPKAYLEGLGKDAQSREDGWSNKPVGTGPYKLLEKKFQEFYRFQAVEDWWGPAGPYVAEITHKVIPETNTRFAALKTKEIDIMTGVGGRAMVDSIQGDQDMRLISIKGTGRASFEFHDLASNPQNSPFRDERVRLAANLAIDKRTIVKEVWGDFAAPMVGTTTPYKWGWDDRLYKNKYFDGKWFYPYDPAKAKQLLAEAGYPNGFDIKMDTAPHPLIPDKERIEQLVASNLTAVGIRTQIYPLEHGLKSQMHRDGKLPGISMIAGTVSSDTRGILRFFYGSRAKYGPTYTGYTDDWMDNMIDKISVELDDAKAHEMVYDFLVYTLDHAVKIPFPAPDGFYAARSNVSDWDRTLSRGYMHGYETMRLVTKR